MENSIIKNANPTYPNVLLSKMEKKISFGFTKVSKKFNLLVNNLEPKDEKNKIELIKCLEGQSIQLVEERKEEPLLVIPLKDGGKTSAALLSLRTRQAVLNDEQIPGEEEETNKEVPKEPNGNKVEDIEKRAARELLAEINKGDEENGTGSALVLPVKAEDLPLEGAKEPTIDDYESIPITQFGKAMLRGMGWKDQPKKKGDLIESGPVLRPKGMGLGADKAVKPKALLVPPEANEVLEIKKGACVRVLGGKHKDCYGQVEGLDDHAGRVIVKMALGSVKESFNEFMVQPVSKKEYAQYSKCINSTKFEEYKRMQNEHGQIILKKENKKTEDDDQRTGHSHRSENRNESAAHKDDSRMSSRRNSPDNSNYQSETRHRSRPRERHYDEHTESSTSNKKYSRRQSPSRHQSQSDDSQSSSNSTSYRSKHKKKSSKSKKSKKSKDKKHERRHSSEASSDGERRHKKKTKKSKRGRSRSRSKGRQ